MLFPALVRTLPYSLLALPLLILAGCGSDLADDPLFNDQQAAVQRVDDELKAVRSQLEEMNRAVSNLLTEVENLKGEPLTGNVSGQRLEQRVEVLETWIKESNQVLGQMKNDLENRIVASPPRSSSSTASRSSSSSETAPAASSSASSSTRVALQRTPSPPKATPTPKPSVGFYHVVKSGETVASIASHYGVSADGIRKGNHIPEGREPIPGQSIYVQK